MTYEHEHKYFIYKTFENYLLIKGSDLYEKVELAVLGCNCGAVIKTKIKDADLDSHRVDSSDSR